jgi:nudix-type nucleoside diphosphatase (YffH/AdpP family)
LLDSEDPAECIRREVEEETGYSIAKVQLVMQTYMSPGSVSEILYLFTGEYNQHMKTGEGGGAEGESENIEVLEFPFEKALHMVASGEIKDAKTILLLQYAAIKGIFGLPCSYFYKRPN